MGCQHTDQNEGKREGGERWGEGEDGWKEGEGRNIGENEGREKEENCARARAPRREEGDKGWEGRDLPPPPVLPLQNL